MGGNDAVRAEWRMLLQRRAADIWTTGEAGPAGEIEQHLENRLGRAASDAVRVVEAYALGARIQRGNTGVLNRSENGAENGAAYNADFDRRLDIVLNGLEQLVRQATAPVAEGARPAQVIQSELWQLLRKMRESAELSYAREQELIELDRRILFLLQNAGPLVPADISSAVGVDKAQVSRSVKRLLELRMLEREQIRAPLRLTRKGESLARRMLRMAELRNRELTFDITDTELDDFFATVETLLDRAIVLYEQEREMADAAGRVLEPGAGGKVAERKSGDPIVLDRTRIISPLMTLSAYFSRSGALAYKRLTGLSTFEAFVLSEIGMSPSVEWGVLVTSLNRDHSQAGRTIKALMDRGLVERAGRPGRRHGSFSPTEKGAQQFAVIHEAGRQRSDFLMEPLGDQERDRFLRTFNKIRRNAEAQLERERAFAELEGE